MSERIDAAPASVPETPVSRNWRTILACAVAFNFPMGFAFGSFSPLVATNELAVGADRASISFGMSCIVTAIGLSSLFLGSVVQRLSPRLVIGAGFALCAAAYAVLGVTSSLSILLAMYTVIGVGCGLASILGPVIVIARQFPGRSGQILGIVNTPVVLFATPYLVALVLPHIGREALYLFMAVLLVALLPLLLLLPGATAPASQQGAAQKPAQAVPARQILGRVDFWQVSLAIGVIAGTGTAFNIHAVPFAQARGLDAATAAMMLSVYSGAGIFGNVILGTLADRIGPIATFSLSALVQVLAWASLALGPVSLLFPLSFLLGLAVVPITTLHGAAMTRMFGLNGLGQAMGYSYAVKLPFLFCLGPIVGAAYLAFADYRFAFLGAAAMLCVATLLFAIAARRHKA
ncbi:MFS transporter [Pedomonas sp. V897]|uniref:MFS transporter n=1 Tax=Pedomonas sp. V897 TaxID=3446482 RepID=UPI003EDF68F6